MDSKDRRQEIDKVILCSASEKHVAGVKDESSRDPELWGIAVKATPGHEEGERAENRNQVGARTPQGAQEALQAPCEGFQAQKVFGGHHEFIQEAQVPLLHLQDRYLRG